MTALDLLQQLDALGVSLTPHPDGTLRCRAPKGTLTPALVDSMRQHRQQLHDLVQEGGDCAAAPTAPLRPEPLSRFYPCMVCGGVDRWDNCGVWRCRRCWPAGSLHRPNACQ